MRLPDNMADLGLLLSAMEGGGDRGRSFPTSDAADFAKGARWIPGNVTLARRDGQRVDFVQDCPCQCCWFWRLPDGSEVHHWDPTTASLIADANKRPRGGKDVGPCPSCGNAHTNGGTS